MAFKKMSSMAQRVKQKAKEAEFAGGSDTLKIKGDMSFFKPKKGKNELIIVPSEMGPGKNLEEIKEDEPWFRLQILKHFRVGPEDKAVICPRTVGKRCPICEHRAALLAQGRSNDDAEVRDLTPKKREVYYVIDLLDDDKLKLFEYSYHNFGKKLEEEIREADDDSLAVNFADPENGAILVVRMGESSMGKNKFLEATRIDFEERGKAEKKLVAEAMEQVTPFSELPIIMSYKDLRALFYDIEDEDAGDSDEDDAPAARRRAPRQDDVDEKPARSARSRRAPEPESDEDDDTNDDEEEETPPQRSRKKVEDAPKRRARPKDPEPEEDANEEDDEEEAPAPVKRRSAPKRPEAEEDEDAPVKAQAKKPDSSSKKLKCPGKGTFGQDCDTLDACEDCDFWADCRDETDEYERQHK